MGKRLLLMALLAGSPVVLGCSDKLETGYEPRRLGSSAAERRAYYASPYTPESIAARHEAGSGGESGFRRPGY